MVGGGVGDGGGSGSVGRRLVYRPITLGTYRFCSQYSSSKLLLCLKARKKRNSSSYYVRFATHNTTSYVIQFTSCGFVYHLNLSRLTTFSFKQTFPNNLLCSLDFGNDFHSSFYSLFESASNLK